MVTGCRPFVKVNPSQLFKSYPCVTQHYARYVTLHPPSVTQHHARYVTLHPVSRNVFFFIFNVFRNNAGFSLITFVGL